MVKAGGADCAAKHRVSGDWLVLQCVHGIGALYRGDEGRGGSASCEIASVLSTARASKVYLSRTKVRDGHEKLSRKRKKNVREGWPKW
jgi:hypothetical protein